MSIPTDIHSTATKCILKYINGTLNFGIRLQPCPISLSAFSDWNWAGDPFDRHSTAGFIAYLGYNPITWSAKKQNTISRSFTESEYRALAYIATELSWLCQVLQDLRIFLSFTPKLWFDNIFALAIAPNPVFHARTKHVEVDYHFVRETVLRRDLQVKYIATGINLLTFSPWAFPLLGLSFSGPKSWCLLTPWFWGGMMEEVQNWWRRRIRSCVWNLRKMKTND